MRRGMIGYLLIACVLVAFGAAFWFLGLRRGAVTVALVWSIVAGIAGTLLTGLWGFTDHLYSYRNENILQLNPVSLVVAATLIALLWRKTPSRLAIASGALVAALSIGGFLVQILPGFDQVNGDVIALALPLHLAVAVTLIALARHRSTKRAKS